MVNKVNIQIMIDTFKRLYKAPLPEHPDKGFNLSNVGFGRPDKGYVQHDCGTAACIMGWGAVIGADKYNGLKCWLNISERLFDRLTTPMQQFGCDFHVFEQPEKFTLQAAIRVLQILRDEDVVDWNRAIENPWSPDEDKAKAKFKQEDWLKSMIDPTADVSFLLTEKPRVDAK